MLKPFDGMGGRSIFVVAAGDLNTNVIIETLTEDGRRFTLAQRYIPEIVHGDKRILLIDGEPIDYALARIPAPGESRGNLVMGARGEGRPLSFRGPANVFENSADAEAALKAGAIKPGQAVVLRGQGIHGGPGMGGASRLVFQTLQANRFQVARDLAAEATGSDELTLVDQP